VPQVEVTFDIDANGIVHVSAKDLGTGKEQSMTITGGSALPKDDIEQMIKDAESHAEEDRKRREAAELRNQADGLAYNTEKTLKEHGDKVDASVKAEVEQAISDLKQALDGDDNDAIKTKMEALMEKSQAMATAIYSQTDAGAATGGAPGDEGATADAEGDVVDAEIVDEGDDQEAAS
jgi:molecular chaperone DnaK